MDHGGQWYQAISHKGWPRKGWLDLSASISPYGPGPKARVAWPGLLSGIDQYPDPYYTDLRGGMARHYGVAPENLLVTAGAVEGLDFFYQMKSPARVIILEPSFSEYRLRAEVHNIPVMSINHLDDVAGIGPGLLVVANPVNPTGALWTPRQADEMLRVAREQGWDVLIDEAFLEFVPDWRKRTCIPYATVHEGVAILGSLTKFYGLAGLRVGFIAGKSSQIGELEDKALPWRIAWPSSEVARISLLDQEFFSTTRDLFDVQRERIAAELSQWGKVYESHVNYVLWEPQHAVSPLIEYLANNGIIVRDARSFKGLDVPAIRVAVKREPEMTRFLEAVRAYFHKR